MRKLKPNVIIKVHNQHYNNVVLVKRKERDIKMANLEESQNQREDRNVTIDQNSPEILTNNIYTPAFLREQIGKLMRVEFLIGTNNLTDRVGILEDVGASYILLRSIENDNIVYADIYAIKFITIASRGNYGNMNSMMNNNMMANPMMNNNMMNPGIMSNKYNY